MAFRRKVLFDFLPKYSAKRNVILLLNLIESCPNSPIFNLSAKEKTIYCKNIAASISSSTWKSYISVLLKYQNIGENIWPWSLPNQIKFLTWLQSKKKISASSSKAYFSAISFFNSFLGFEFKNVSKTTNLFVRGWENISFHKKYKKFKPISFLLLKKLKSKIKKKFSSKTKRLVLWAICCLSFFGSLRLSEFLPQSEFFTDFSSNLFWSDINIHKNHLIIKIKHPKTFPSSPINVTFFNFPIKKYCPIIAIKNLKKHILINKKWTENTSFAKIKNGKFVSCRKFTKIIKYLLRKEKGNFSARSFRAGIPSEMEKFPELFNDLHIKNWGRWKSNSYQRYMKQDFSQKKWIFNRLSKILK